MTVDFTKFAFSSVENPHAKTLTEGIAADPVSGGFIVVTLKAIAHQSALEAIRTFASALREGAQSTGFVDVTAYRQLRDDELGGAVPFDQTICSNTANEVKRRQATQASKFPGLNMVLGILEQNALADWVLLVEYQSTDQAHSAAKSWKKGDVPFDILARSGASLTVNAFRNGMRYANVSRDPNVIQFFNLFPNPGDIDVLWQAWQDALPWFLEIGEIRSSFPLLALDAEQPLLLVNVAHCDSVKHFFRGVAFDPLLLEVMKTCYTDRGVSAPMPFFCKIVPV